MADERAVVLDQRGDRLLGILHLAPQAADMGVLIVVGGPQYRVGSHRQFVGFARHIAAAGYPVLRFDYRGMGDSEGVPRSFENIEDDIRIAIDYLEGEVPELRRVALLGLCDAASASLMYAHNDSRVASLILLNPWVRTVQGEAKAYLRHYYLQRLLQRSFWKKVATGGFGLMKSIRDLAKTIKDSGGQDTDDSATEAGSPASFVFSMNAGFDAFEHPVLILISGRDLVAQEFMDLCASDNSWRKVLQRPEVVVHKLEEADHTLSDPLHFAEATKTMIRFLNESATSTNRETYD